MGTTILELLLAFLSTYGEKVSSTVPETAESLLGLGNALAQSNVLSTEDSNVLQVTLSAMQPPVVEAVGTVANTAEAVIKDVTVPAGGILSDVADAVAAPFKAILGSD